MFHSKVRLSAPDLADPASALFESSRGRDYPVHSNPFGQPTRATSSAPDWISTITPQTFVRQSRKLDNMELPNVPTTDSRCHHGVSEDEKQVQLTAHLNLRLSGNQPHRYDRVKWVGEKAWRANYGRLGQVSSEQRMLICSRPDGHNASTLPSPSHTQNDDPYHLHQLRNVLHI